MLEPGSRDLRRLPQSPTLGLRSGYYSASFSWPPRTGAANGAYIIFPRISHALRLRINEKEILPLDYNAPRVDIGPYMKQGNEILVIVPTTMWDYLRSILDQIKM